MLVFRVPSSCLTWKAKDWSVAVRYSCQPETPCLNTFKNSSALFASGVGFTLLHPAEGHSVDRHRYPASVCTIFNNIYFDYGILDITPIFSPSFRLWSDKLQTSLLRIYHSACFSILVHPEGMRCDTETFLHRHSGYKPLCKTP